MHIKINDFLKIPTTSAKDLEASGQINHPTTRLVLVGYMHKQNSVLFEATDKIPHHLKYIQTTEFGPLE